MALNVQDLPEKIRELAIKRALVYSSNRTRQQILEMRVDAAFNWMRTAEGSTYWQKMSEGEFPEQYQEPKIQNNYEIF